MKFLSTNTPDRKTTVLLWIIQGLLALLFLFTSGMKLVMPIEAMTKDIQLPGPVPAIYWRGGSARRDWPDPARASAHSAGTDAAGRRRAGDHHGRCDGAHAEE